MGSWAALHIVLLQTRYPNKVHVFNIEPAWRRGFTSPKDPISYLILALRLAQDKVAKTGIIMLLRTRLGFAAKTRLRRGFRGRERIPRCKECRVCLHHRRAREHRRRHLASRTNDARQAVSHPVHLSELRGRLNPAIRGLRFISLASSSTTGVWLSARSRS